MTMLAIRPRSPRPLRRLARVLLGLVPLAAALLAGPVAAAAQERRAPLRIEITEGVIEPLPIAIAPFIAEGPGARALADRIAGVVEADLVGSGLFRAIPRKAHLGRITGFDAPIQFADWTAINAQALVTGKLAVGTDRIEMRFRLFDVFAGREMGQGLRFAGRRDDWRRIGHKIADAIYERLTGEKGYFDSMIAFVEERGPKGNRRKRVAIMDQDGANLRYLTSEAALVMAPVFSPDGRQLLFTSWASGEPRVYLLELASMRARLVRGVEGMTFAPRFAPDGRKVILSATRAGNTDLYEVSLATGAARRLTRAPSIETAPSYSPDGRFITFESDRSGSPQLYVMPAGGGEARRISFGRGRYHTPVWSPRGDLIAFTKQVGNRFHIGVMRTDGSEERLLTSSFLDEGPSFAPNGRVVIFFREPPGPGGAPALYTVDVTGRNLKRLPTPAGASDPAWSPLRR